METLVVSKPWVQKNQQYFPTTFCIKGKVLVILFNEKWKELVLFYEMQVFGEKKLWLLIFLHLPLIIYSF